MEATPTSVATAYWDRLSAAAWSPEQFSRWVTESFQDPRERRELARELVRTIAEGLTPETAFPCAVAAFILSRHHQCLELLKEAPPGEAVTYVRALALTRLGRGETALPLLKELLKKHPRDRQLRRAEVEALLDGDPEAAQAKQEAYAADFRGPEAELLRGMLLERTGRLEEALDVYRSLAEEDHPEGLFRLALALDRAGADEEAIRTYERLLDIQPTYPEALLNLGVLYDDREQYEQAIRCFKALLQLDPYHERARLYLRDAEASLDMYYDEEQERLEEKFNQILRTPITDFELSVRSRNCLAKMNIETLGDLVQKTEQELLSYKNFGETSLAEIKEILASKGLRLGMPLGKDEEGRRARERAIALIFGPQKRSLPPGSLVRSAAAPPQSAPAPSQGDPSVLLKPVSELAFSARIRRALAMLNVTTLGDLLDKTEADFLAIKNFGQTSLEELKRRLAEFGITLRKS